MTIIQAIILGLVQGLTEFIPVSSSAHLIIVPWLFGWTNPALTSLPFDVALHLGTLLAVLAYFAADWVRLIRAGIASLVERRIGRDPDRRLAWLLVIGSIPGAVIGALAESKIEALFHQPGVPVSTAAMIALAVMLALLGAALMAAERLARHVRALNQVTLRDAILIGLSQALAIFPGVSRSGATITAGLGLGLTRETAARFSFLLSAPIIAGAGAKSLYEIYKGMQSGAIASADLGLFPIGFIAAAVSGYLCIRFLLAYLRSHSTSVFVYYRWALAVLIVIVALVR
ncbi:MAG: undecaprenyl-diphosphate phosphatase [Anaerolineales bacterium]